MKSLPITTYLIATVLLTLISPTAALAQAASASPSPSPSASATASPSPSPSASASPSPSPSASASPSPTPTSSPAVGAVSSPSASASASASGQVLGAATTLGETGAEKDFPKWIFVIGSGMLALLFGLKIVRSHDQE